MTLIEEEKHRENPYELIAGLVDLVAEEVCERHYDAPTQEHQLSAKLADAFERELRSLFDLPFEITVKVQDFPDKGKGSWEKESGADLYISLVIHDDEKGTVNKGMLVQSKWDHTFKPNNKDFREQCEKMLELSKSSYVWKFGPHGVESVQAEDVLNPPQESSFSESPHTVGKQIADGIKCTQGDETIGRDLTLRDPESLTDIMRRLSVDKVMTITARKNHSFLRDD
ncbi:hypothetical protein FFI89_000990 [Bradyrhizobium sp. KBS0727]|uniref:hypothetical protein n=1 Tax=unclassified Bradyrhizobium TaxID=2631580 RepID=UPI00110E7EE0|nr:MULTISPECIES: hypothetical protein [unclassified Bradyrhizobium]QDW35837.1 hypothetical protein FFI71_000990 [Bradyrhizobium sp. KBS0725]QDW42437.1 hypothetical protein FFI89_000990 [Bradyrhizobium sp. KBS0727]